MPCAVVRWSAHQCNEYLKSDDIDGPHEDLTGVVVDEDTAAIELELALSKARRLNQSKFSKRSNERDIAAALRHNDDDDDDQQDGLQVVLNSTSEFCRSLGEISTYRKTGNRNENKDDDDMDASLTLFCF